MDIRERFPIAEADVEKLLEASKHFAERENVDWDGRRGPRGFTIFLESGDLNIVAYNTEEPDFVYVRTWHYSQFSEADRDLATRFVQLVKQTVGADPPG